MRLVVALAVGVSVCALTASGSLGQPLVQPLAWAPPALVDPVTIDVTNANRRLVLDDSRDYRLNIVETLSDLFIEGGRNVVVVGGRITIDQLGSGNPYWDNTAIKVRFGDPAGTVHLEGLLIDGGYVNDAIAIATGRTVQVENVHIARVYDNIKNGHSDCIQIQQGVGHLRVDKLTCSTGRHGIFLGDHNGPIRGADLRRVNIYSTGGAQLLWQQEATYPVSLADVWLGIGAGFSAFAPFGYWVFPQIDGRTLDGKRDRGRRAVVSRDGRRLWFVGSNITGIVRRGRPTRGDFVRPDNAGTAYVSPGYVSATPR